MHFNHHEFIWLDEELPLALMAGCERPHGLFLVLCLVGIAPLFVSRICLLLCLKVFLCFVLGCLAKQLVADVVVIYLLQ